MRILLVSFFLINSIISSSQNNSTLYFESGDSLYVAAKSGLKIRKLPSIESEALGIVKFGQRINTISDAMGDFMKIENRLGQWVEIKYGKFEGFVFSGYLSKNQYEKTEFGEPYMLFSRIHDLIEQNLDSLICEGEHLQKSRGKGSQSYYWKIYKDGTKITEICGYEWCDYEVESYKLNMNDLLNYLEYIVLENLEEFGLSRLPRIKVETDYSGRIVEIKCQQLEFYAKKEYDKITLRSLIYSL